MAISVNFASAYNGGTDYMIRDTQSRAEAVRVRVKDGISTMHGGDYGAVPQAWIDAINERDAAQHAAACAKYAGDADMLAFLESIAPRPVVKFSGAKLDTIAVSRI
jgi:hypothetical protein